MTPEYFNALETVAPGVTNLIDSTGMPGESWFDTLPRLLTGLIATDQQRKILQIQIDRAKAGLSPLDASQYGMGVNVGLSPDTLSTLKTGGVIIGGILLLTLLKKGR